MMPVGIQEKTAPFHVREKRGVFKTLYHLYFKSSL